MIRKLYIERNPSMKAEWNQLLEKENIKSESTIDETFGYFEDNKLVATASRYQNVIKCVAVDSDTQGGALFNQIISHVMNRSVEEGYFKHYLYTKVETQDAFKHLGFKTIETVDNKLVFMEKAVSGFDDFINNLSKEKVEGDSIASIVMNANPFTLGHLYLVESAAKENDVLHVFVLSEEMSVFSNAIRTRLVKEGCAHLDNVYVHQTENYMVSNATFPSYFLKEDDNVTKLQARLDAKLFANYIAKSLNITKRYVGSEPFSNATNIYNEALLEEFNDKIQLVILERTAKDDTVISATMIRTLLSQNEVEKTKPFVPKSTYDFFFTEDGLKVIELLRTNHYEKP